MFEANSNNKSDIKMYFLRKSMFYHILKNKLEHGMSKKSPTTFFFRLVTNLKRQDTFVRCIEMRADASKQYFLRVMSEMSQV